MALFLQEKEKQNPEEHSDLPQATLGTLEGEGDEILQGCQKVSSRSNFSFAAIHVERITITFLC